MKKQLILLALIALALIVVACGAPPTPTPVPSPTVPPAPPATATATRAPATATATRTLTPTPSQPTATTIPPTRTPIPAPVVPTVLVQPSPTSRPVSKPTGTIVVHTKVDGIDRLMHVDPNSGASSPFVSAGASMDYTLDSYGTNVRAGEFSAGNAFFAYVFAGAPGAVNVLKVRATNGDNRDITSENGISSPSWSPDNRRIMYIRVTPTGWFISIIDADGKNRENVPIPEALANAQFRGGLSWSKDNLIAFAANVGGASDVYTNYPDGKQLRKLTDHPADDTTPMFSPDGKLIAFSSTRDGNQQIYVMNADGSGLRRVRRSNTNDTTPTWSPDGNWIAFSSTPVSGGATDLFIMDLFGGNVKQLGAGDHPAWTK